MTSRLSLALAVPVLVWAQLAFAAPAPPPAQAPAPTDGRHPDARGPATVADPALGFYGALYVPATAQGGPPGAFALYMTGDGGWAPFDKKVVSELAGEGAPTVMWNMNAYFRTKRTPEEAAAAFSQVMARGAQLSGRRTVVVIGYSFGADVAPALVNRLPDAQRRAIRLLALMGPSNTSAWQVTLTERGGLSAPGEAPTAPEIARLVPIPIVCLQGRQDKDSICPSVTGANVRAITTRGGHGFAKDGAGVARDILEAVR
jgi:type IV secretory pathway VirJ component